MFLASVLALFAMNAFADFPGVHGMLVFGKDKTYVSHLPMYHAPHDYQLIMEVSLLETPSGSTVEKYNRIKMETTDYFTIEPKPMDLTDLISGKKLDFIATLYQGHFERGGTPLGKVNVHLEKIISVKKLIAAEPNPEPQYESFVLFGQIGEYFAAHIINGRPNFDGIFEVEQAFSNIVPCRRICEKSPVKDSTLPITIPGQNSNRIPEPGNTIGSLDKEHTKILNAIYVEEGDLSH